jgi:glycerol-3-phosphate dehydrogenase (NAD(P)+)
MSGVAILGAGAFGTALAMTLARDGPVTLWTRDGTGGGHGAHAQSTPPACRGVACPIPSG